MWPFKKYTVDYTKHLNRHIEELESENRGLKSRLYCLTHGSEYALYKNAENWYTLKGEIIKKDNTIKKLECKIDELRQTVYRLKCSDTTREYRYKEIESLAVRYEIRKRESLNTALSEKLDIIRKYEESEKKNLTKIRELECEIIRMRRTVKKSSHDKFQRNRAYAYAHINLILYPEYRIETSGTRTYILTGNIKIGELCVYWDRDNSKVWLEGEECHLNKVKSLLESYGYKVV